MTTVTDVPNAYDDLIRAANSLVNVELLEDNQVEEISEVELQEFVDANREQLVAARAALQRGCRVPLRFEEAFWEGHFNDYSPIRWLARGFAAQIIANAQAERFAEAVSAGVDLLDFANAVRRNGLITDQLVSIAVSAIGVEHLRKIRRRWSGDDAHFLARQLLRIDGERESFDAIAERDSLWEHNVGWDNRQPAPQVDDLDIEEGVDPEFSQAINQLINEFIALPTTELRRFERKLDDENLVLLRLLCLESAL